MYDVHGKTAVVTGAASGIGLGMARAFAAAGMSLVLADVESDRLDTVVDGFVADGRRAIGVQTDVSDEAQVQALADAAIAEFDAVHVVVNNAGVGIGGAVDKLPLEDWRWIVDVNMWGVIYGVRKFLPLLKAQGEGHIMATSSMAGLVGVPMLGAYSVSKHAVVGLMDTVRMELRMAKSPVRASVMCPGPVDTDVNRSARNRPRPANSDDASDGQKQFTSDLTNQLAGGLQPDEVGDMALDAIRNERFWILTHPEEHLPVLDQQLESIHRQHDHWTP